MLLDTQVLLWAIYKPERLPSHIMDLLGETDNQLLVSDASVWEMGIKLAKGKLEYESELPQLLERMRASASFRSQLIVGTSKRQCSFRRITETHLTAY